MAKNKVDNKINTAWDIPDVMPIPVIKNRPVTRNSIKYCANVISKYLLKDTLKCRFKYIPLKPIPP